MKVLLLLVSIFAIAEATFYAIKLKSGSPETYAAEHGLQYIESVLDYHIFRKHSINSDHSFLYHPNVAHYSRQTVKRQYTRAISDPLYPQQWHLRQLQFDVVNTGKGVTVAIVDDGLQHSHLDLRDNYNPLLSYDFNGKDMDPAPNTFQNDGHGTSAAGVCGAVCGNTHCGCGVAPKVSLVGIRLIAEPTYDFVEAQGMLHKNQNIDIYSCSWGPYDGGEDLQGPGHIMLDALEQGIRTGRRGKGNIFVWAGGNGRQNSDNGNYDGYANHWATIAIGASDHTGKQAWYSEDCACLMAVAPSSGSRQGITTVDLKGPAGYSPGECTDNFGGTSSAAPLAAGVVALILEKHPEFTWRDVQHVIAKGATQIDVTNSDWTPRNRGRGYLHSHHYGFGELKIPLLLQTAREHVPSSIGTLQTLIASATGVAGFETTVHFSGHLPNDFVEQVLVTITFYHPNRGQVRLELVHDGVTSILADKRNDRHSGDTTWTYSTVRHWGQRTTGDWTVTMIDTVPDQLNGFLKSVSIKILGH